MWYLNGVSRGDFREALQALLGREVVGLSAETIVRRTAVWQREDETWRQRDLSGSRSVYWWGDGISCNVRWDTDRQCLLVVIGARLDGTKELLALEEGFRESADSGRSVWRALKRRGLTQGPPVASGDGAWGFWAAWAEEFPSTQHQLCGVQQTANGLDTLPTSLPATAKSMLHDRSLAPTQHAADAAWACGLATCAEQDPQAVAGLTAHRDERVTGYAAPAEHGPSLRSTNVIASTFATVRLRTKRTKGCGSRLATLTMGFQLIESAATRWHRLRGYRPLADGLHGVPVHEGVPVEATGQRAPEPVGG